MSERKLRPITEEDFKAELAAYAEGLDVERFYYAWRFLIVLWRSVWWCSNVSWGRYRRTIWDKFARWIASAGRRSRDLTTFIAVFSREAKLASVGANRDERHWIMQVVALPYDEQRAILRQLREDTSLLVAFVREYQDQYKPDRDEQSVDWQFEKGG